MVLVFSSLPLKFATATKRFLGLPLKYDTTTNSFELGLQLCSRLYMAEKETKRNGNFRVRLWVRNSALTSFFKSQRGTMQSFFWNIMKNYKHSAAIYKMIFKYSKALIWNWNILQSRYDSFRMSHLIMSHFILQQLVIEWKDREECCFGYVAMVSDAIPERNLMTFTKGSFLVPIRVWLIRYSIYSYRMTHIGGPTFECSNWL